MKFYTADWWFVVNALIAFVFIIGGIVLGHGSVFSWIIAIFSTYCLFATAKNLSSPVIILDNEGIKDIRIHSAHILWDNIESIQFKRCWGFENIFPQSVIIVSRKNNLIEETKLAQELIIRFGTVNPPIEKAFEYINSIHPEKIKSAQENHK